MTDAHKTTEHKAGNGGTDPKAADATAKDATAAEGQMTYETFEPKGETIEAHLADKTGVVDTVAGPAAYRPGDLIVKDTTKSVPLKQLHYIIPAETASAQWQKSTKAAAGSSAASPAGSHAQEAAPANHTTKK